MRSAKLLLLASAIISFSYLVFRLADLSKLISTYPLNSEAVTQIAQLFFLKACGFHVACPHWYNGFTTFLVTPPGWYFFALPFYSATSSVLFATYATLILSVAAAFFIFIFSAKHIRLTKLQGFVFFSLLFGSNVIVKTISFVRTHELFAWVAFFAGCFALFYYKKRDLDLRFFLFSTTAFFVALLAHQSIGILLAAMFAGFVLSREKEKIMACLPLLFGLVLSSFWWLPFAKALLSNEISIIPETAVVGWQDLHTINFTSVAFFALPAALFLSFWLAWRQERHNKSFFVLFLPLLVIAVLFVSGLARLLPFLKNISTYMYFTFFIFFVLYFLLSQRQSNFFKKLLAVLLLAAAISGVAISATATPLFATHTQTETDIISLLPKIEGNYIFVNKFPDASFPPAYYGYAAIFHGKTTIGGWAPHMKNFAYIKKLEYFKNMTLETCAEATARAADVNLTSLVGYGATCNIFSACGFKDVAISGQACLYALNY